MTLTVWNSAGACTTSFLPLPVQTLFREVEDYSVSFKRSSYEIALSVVLNSFSSSGEAYAWEQANLGLRRAGSEESERGGSEKSLQNTVFTNMNPMWKSYRSKVLKTLNPEYEEDTTEEVRLHFELFSIESKCQPGFVF